MRFPLVPTVLLLAAAPLSAQNGIVSNVAVSNGRNGEAILTISGTNPCPAVHVDYGDGSAPVTHAVRQLPAAVSHAYPQAGSYTVRARGMGNCGGDIVRNVRVGPNGATARAGAGTARFAGVDANGDGAIQRSEWRGSDRSFQVHDWNGDGVLDGDEVRTGRSRPRPEFDDYTGDAYAFDDWSASRFRQLDRNNDGRVSRVEWVYGAEEFARVDRNRDNFLSLAEFNGSDFDDDRGDRFDYLDVNSDNRIQRSEWHASPMAFNWLDRNRDGVITREEMGGTPGASDDAFTNLDTNRDQRVSGDEWVWSQRSFEQRDANQDGVLTRSEFAATQTGRFGTAGPRATAVVVASNQQWTDTGLVIQRGDRVRFSASGIVQLSTGTNDLADPKGSRIGRFAAEGPLPRDPAGALIARIGETSAVLIGNRTDTILAPSAGRLYLGVNDDFFDDNQGSFNVEVVVTR